MNAYVGRFAPTPSGPLHLGSLLTAVASYLDARAARGRWLLRFDDLDRPRVKSTAIGLIREQLQAHGLIWDDEPRYQSRHVDRYREALDRLRHQGLLYSCACSRSRLRTSVKPPAFDLDFDEPPYPGWCREADRPETDAALRVRLPASGELVYRDMSIGVVSRPLGAELGDFIVRRRDGLIAYQLACVIDEAEQGITDVVRGRDLLHSTLRQRWLMQQLALTLPRYRHLPLMVDAGGRKLSKRDGDGAVDPARAPHNLLRVLNALGQDLPPDHYPSVERILEWAVNRWNPSAISHDAIRVESV